MHLIRSSKPILTTLLILYNEVSIAFKNEIQKICNLQLVPLDTHHWNLVEREISKLLKVISIAILTGADPTFPLSLWDCLVPKPVIALNLMQQAHAALTVSTYHYGNNAFDYNIMSLAQLGCNVQIHELTNRQRMWDAHSLNGWYLGTSSKHDYYKKICQKTCSEQISDTAFFQHQYISQPAYTPEDQIIKSIGDLKSALQMQINICGSEEIKALKTMDEIFQEHPQITGEEQNKANIAMTWQNIAQSAWF